MMKKQWNKPTLEVLDINKTMWGSNTGTVDWTFTCGAPGCDHLHEHYGES